MRRLRRINEHVEGTTKIPRHARLLLATLVLVDLIAAVVFVTAPSAGTVRGYFISEDSLIENLTAGLYLCTFSAALLLLTNGRLRNRKSCKWLGALSVLGLVGFLDEISFGERLFDLKMPVVGDTKIDAVHDLVDLGLSQVDRLGSEQAQLVLFVFLSGLVLLCAAILKYGKSIRETIIRDRYYPLYVVALIVVLLGCSALALDTERFAFRGANALEECLELNVALAMLASCFMIYTIEKREPCL